MNSTPDSKVTESDKVTQPDEALIARADERLAHAYEQIARADEQLARVTEQLSKLEQDATGHPLAVPGRQPSHGRLALRGVTGLLVAACVLLAAFVSQSSYGDATKLTIARWAPHLTSTSSLALEKPGLPAQGSTSTVQVATAEAAPPLQATPSAQTAPHEAAPTAAPLSPKLAESLQTITRDLANVAQGIEQLKAGQEQMASDNAKATEQLKASQEQVTRLIAKVSEQNLRPKPSAPPPRPIAAPTRKPVPTLPQARAQPIELRPEEQ
jgi:hypothetical protein